MSYTLYYMILAVSLLLFFPSTINLKRSRRVWMRRMKNRRTIRFYISYFFVYVQKCQQIVRTMKLIICIIPDSIHWLCKNYKKMRCKLIRSKRKLYFIATQSFQNVRCLTHRIAKNLRDRIHRHPDCQICYVDRLWDLPTIELDSCPHIFHLDCVKHILQNRWIGARVSFHFRGCPLCKVPMKHSSITKLNDEIDAIYDALCEKLLDRLKYDGLEATHDIVDENGAFYNDKIGYALKKYAYYLCAKCDSPYYVGLNHCLAAGDNIDDELDKKLFVCLSCRAQESIEDHRTHCDIHGNEYIEYKCKFCCSIATFNCGTTHFCELCHKKAGARWSSERDGTLKKECPMLPNKDTLELETVKIDQCPLGIKHPDHGNEYCLGCGLCNAQRFKPREILVA